MTHLLTSAERAPFGVIYRVILGFVLFPLASLVRLPITAWWGGTVQILTLLIALRVGPAVIRKAVRFPDEIRTVWAERRQLAKRHDSYQWRKLSWIGLGLCGYLALAGDHRPSRTIPSLACLSAGVAGSVIWARRRRGADVQNVLSGILAGD